MYIDPALNSTIVKEASYSTENVLEGPTVETEGDNSKNVWLGCVYRPPGTNGTIFNDKMSEMLNVQIKQK